ncbi:ABC-type protease/lipase transport system fused ATPase/permease subunit [Methylorubrum pseudosasae]|nr:ABC-type protease/lipase transport system fused ATPase/permease subunit [Methylorubrum pseudosasae]
MVLDEPNANLDAEGENALTQAILGVRQRGGICVVVAHRPSALAGLDLILMMADGRVQAFGPKDEILKRVLRPAPAPIPAAAEPAVPSIRESA